MSPMGAGLLGGGAGLLGGMMIGDAMADDGGGCGGTALPPLGRRLYADVRVAVHGVLTACCCIACVGCCWYLSLSRDGLLLRVLNR